MATLHLAQSASTSLRGWFCPKGTVGVRAEHITSVKVAPTSAHFILTVESLGGKQEFRFTTLELLNEALSLLHLEMTDLD